MMNKCRGARVLARDLLYIIGHVKFSGIALRILFWLKSREVFVKGYFDYEQSVFR